MTWSNFMHAIVKFYLFHLDEQVVSSHSTGIFIYFNHGFIYEMKT